MSKKPSLLDSDQCLSINRAVAEAEQRTSAEILPVVARSSGRYDRAEDIVGLWTAIILAGLAWYFVQGVGTAGDSWIDEPYVRLGFLVVAVLMVVGFIGGAAVASRVHWLRRLFTPRREMDQEIVARAKAVFFDRRVHRTSESCGVLIYVSLYERSAVILVDDAVRAQLSDRSIEEVREELESGIRSDGTVGGSVRAVNLLGKLLEVALPAAEGEGNDIRNEVVLLD